MGAKPIIKTDLPLQKRPVVAQSLNVDQFKDYKHIFNEFTEAKLQLIDCSESFDFSLFQVRIYFFNFVIQEVRNNQESFSVFQRFCLLMLIVHGELERVQTDKSDEFLKQLNVYHEITNIKNRIDESKY